MRVLARGDLVLALTLILATFIAALPAMPEAQHDGLLPLAAMAKTTLTSSSAAVPATTFPDGGGTITRIDLGPKGNPGYNREGPAGITADGRTVFFNSGNLFYTTPDGIQLGTGVPWARDQATGTTKALAAQTFFPASLPDIIAESFSADGRYFAFESSDSTIVAGDTNGVSDVFVKDTLTGAVTRVSVKTDGTQGNGGSYFPHLSADGRYVAFQSDATNLVKTDRNGVRDIFLRDRTLNTTILVSVSSSGTQGNQASGSAYQPDSAVSADGRYVAYVSAATNLVSGDTNLRRDVFLYDRTTAATTRVSVGTPAVQSNGDSEYPAISGDGRYVAFASQSTNFAGGGTNLFLNVYVRDRTLSTTTRLSARTSGAMTTGDSLRPAVSSDGHYVAFDSSDPLISSDTNGFADVYVADITNGALTRVSVGNAGEQANSSSYGAYISQDGRFVTFVSNASNLVAGAPGGGALVYDRLGADFGAAYPFTFGGNEKDCKFSCAPVKPGTGSYTTGLVDLVLPGRLIDLAFARTYNSDDKSGGPFGYGWSHSFHWRLRNYGASVEVRASDGSRDVYTKNPDGTYANPPDVFNKLVANPDGTFTLTQKDQRMFEFDGFGLLTRIHEPAGNQITLTYTGALLSSITDTVGRQVTLSYNADGTMSQIQDPTGRRVTYSYDTTGRLSTVTDKIGNSTGQDPALHRWTYAYDGTTHRLRTITDPDGRIRVTNTYDASGRVIEQRDGLNALTTFAYTANQIVVTDPRLHQVTKTFDGRTRTLTRSEIVGGITYSSALTYDTAGNVLSSRDRNGGVTDYTYDARGNVLTRTDPQINPQTPRYVTTFEYDTSNNVTRVIDAKNFVTTHTYDLVKDVRLSTTSDIDATTTATTKYEYSDAANPGLVTRVIAPRGNTSGTPDYAYSTVLTYNATANLVQSVDADAAKMTFGYDSLGRRTTVVDPDGYAPGGIPAEHTWTIGHDANDQVTSEANPLNQTTSTTYDGAGNLKTGTDRRGNVTTYMYDAAARLWKVQQKPDPPGQPSLVYETVIGRDLNGNATIVTQANGALTNYAYDELDRLTTTTVHPSTGVNLATTLVLDGNGNVTSRTTADSVTATYTYDALSRLKTVSASGLSTITYGYDELSRRTSMQDVTGTTTYVYDRLSRLTSAAQPNGTTDYVYDRDSNRTSVTYPGVGGGAATYAYSNGGRLNTVTDWSSRTSTYSYLASGLADTVSVPGGIVVDYGYDRAQRLTSLTNMVGATPITTHSYTLDAEGNRTQLVEFLSGVTTPGQTETFGFSYDGLNRLTTVTTTNPESFTLDAGSNITARTGPSATYTIDGENRPTSDGTNTITWSSADRLTGRGADTFGYDPLDRLTSSTVAGTSRTYGYSGDGLLQSRTQGTTTNLLWDPATSPSRLLQHGGDRIVYGLGPLYVIKADGTTRALAGDGGKSVRAEVDGSGSLTGSWRYRAYGVIAQNSGQSLPSILGYAGQLLDPSGLYYMRARWYDSGTGRFVTRDPMPGAMTLPVALNAYGYANLNPVVRDDPTGACNVPWRIVQLLCEAAQKLGPTLQRAWPSVQRFFQRPAVQQGMQEGETGVAAEQTVVLRAGELGKIIGWGTGQSANAVAQTEAVTQGLTTEGVQAMIAQGLTRAFVEGQLASYTTAFAEGGAKLGNAQLLPRLELMQKILELWPTK